MFVQLGKRNLLSQTLHLNLLSQILHLNFLSKPDNCLLYGHYKHATSTLNS